MSESLQGPDPAPKGKPPAEWISGADACRILAITHPMLVRLGEKRKIARRVIPGLAPKYSRTDVERLAAAATMPALENGPGA